MFSICRSRKRAPRPSHERNTSVATETSAEPAEEREGVKEVGVEGKVDGEEEFHLAKKNPFFS